MLLFFDNEFSPVVNERLYERLLGNNYICFSKDVPCQWNIVQSVNEGGVFWSVHFSSNTNILVAARGSPRKIELWTNHLFQWRPLLSGCTLVVNATASLRMETSHKNSEKKIRMLRLARSCAHRCRNCLFSLCDQYCGIQTVVTWVLYVVKRDMKRLL